MACGSAQVNAGRSVAPSMDPYLYGDDPSRLPKRDTPPPSLSEDLFPLPPPQTPPTHRHTRTREPPNAIHRVSAGCCETRRSTKATARTSEKRSSLRFDPLSEPQLITDSHSLVSDLNSTHCVCPGASRIGLCACNAHFGKGFAILPWCRPGLDGNHTPSLAEEHKKKSALVDPACSAHRSALSWSLLGV